VACGPDAEAAIEASFAAVATVHRLMSFHDPESDVSRLNRRACAEPVAVAPETLEVLVAALDLHRETAGLFDIAIAPVLQDLSLLPRSSAAIRAGEGAATSASIEILSSSRVRFHHPDLRIDLGGIAKGFAVDCAAAALRAAGVTSGVVNAGGDIASFGPQAEPVGIRDPRAGDRLLCRVELCDQALASSARNRAGMFTETAIVDPRTRGVAPAIGATVRAPRCLYADALTKVVMLAAAESLAVLERYGASAILVDADGDVHVTADWQEVVRLAA